MTGPETKKETKPKGKLVEVELLSTCHVKGCEGTRGTIVKMPEDLAKRLIERRGAKLVKDEEKE